MLDLEISLTLWAWYYKKNQNVRHSNFCVCRFGSYLANSVKDNTLFSTDS